MKLSKPNIRAGGFNVVDGGPGYRLVPRNKIRRWRTIVRRVLIAHASRNKGSNRAAHMLNDAATTWSTYAKPSSSLWSSLSPHEKQMALFSYILTRQTKRPRKAVDILAAGLAGLLWWEHHVQPRHDDYTRAVDCARSVFFLFRWDWREYEHDDGHGTVRIERRATNKNVKLRSRYACQRIEAEVMHHAGWFLKEYRAELVGALVAEGLIDP